jgi:hypothetical protein
MRRENQMLTPMEEAVTSEGRDTCASIDSLVHLGAGLCSELDTYLSLVPARLLLVEADPQVATALQARTAQLPNVQVLCNAVAGSAGPVVLYRYNLPGSSSLHPASGLLQLFPGMKALEETPLEAVAPATLLEPLQLSAEEDNLLVVDLPGEELPVLQALWDATLLQLFNQVKLRCGREPLYHGGEPAAQILRWLEDHGFDLLREEDGDDADYPCWTLQRNQLQLRNLELAQRLTGLEEQLRQSNQTRDAQAKRLSEQQKQLAEQKSLEQRRRRKRAAGKARCRTAGADSAAHAARDEQATLVGERQAQLDKLQQERDAASKQLDEQKALLGKPARRKLPRKSSPSNGRRRFSSSRRLGMSRPSWSASARRSWTRLQQERDAATKQLDEQKALEQANQAKAAQEKLAAERQAQIQQLTQARDEQAKLAGERQAQLDKAAAGTRRSDQATRRAEGQLLGASQPGESCPGKTRRRTAGADSAAHAGSG